MVISHLKFEFPAFKVYYHVTVRYLLFSRTKLLEELQFTLAPASSQNRQLKEREIQNESNYIGLNDQNYREHILFNMEADKVANSAGINQSYPTGRGLFVSHLKDTFISINFMDHVNVGILQKDANLKMAFQRLKLTFSNIENNFKWARDQNGLGFLTTSPALVGSALKIYAYVKLPYLGLEDNFRQEILDQYGLECVKATENFALSDSKIFVLSNKRTFGLTESEILSNVQRGLKEVILIENKFNDSAKNNDLV